MNWHYQIFFVSRKNRLCTLCLPRKTLFAIFLFFLTIMLGAIGLFIYNTNLSLTEMKQNIAEEQFHEYSKKINQLKSQLSQLKLQLEQQILLDNKQRNFLQIASIHPDIWSMGIGGRINHNKFARLSFYNKKLLEELSSDIEILKGQIKLREQSIREIENKVSQKFELWKHIPSLNPVPGAELSSGFGYRVDPFEKDVRMHEGIDLSAPKGTPIYATGDGVVTFADWNMGYGYVVDIDHGYGFVTRYAHLSKILVKEGELVKRGQIIGRVGGTGRAICPHLHYEVIVAGVKVNPVKYINFRDVIVD